MSQTMIVVAIVVLAVSALLIFFLGKRRTDNRLTRLASLAFVFIFAGAIFGDNRVLAFSLMGIGVVLAAADIYTRSQNE